MRVRLRPQGPILFRSWSRNFSPKSRKPFFRNEIFSISAFSKVYRRFAWLCGSHFTPFSFSLTLSFALLKIKTPYNRQTNKHTLTLITTYCPFLIVSLLSLSFSLSSSIHPFLLYPCFVHSFLFLLRKSTHTLSHFCQWHFSKCDFQFYCSIKN